MTQVTLQAAVGMHTTSDPNCPFCPGDKEKEWKTYPGSANDAKILRAVMNKPSTLTNSGRQPGARPKTGGQFQVQDTRRLTYRSKRDGVIFQKAPYGDYGDQAHHAISGNQIMSGQDIEKLIHAEHGEIEKDTGYSVNNCANGVCLPAYPKSYGKRGATVKWSDEDEVLKVKIMKYPMEAGKGQVHISDHDIDFDSEDEEVAECHHTTYPDQAKRKLQALYNVTKSRWVPTCPVCKEDDGKTQKKPLPPPYRINGWLDSISGALIRHITVPAVRWVYFISDYARDYHYDICEHPKSRHGS